METITLDKTFGDLLNSASSTWGDSKAIIYNEKSYTYLNLNNITDLLAKGLLSYGVQKGDKVALWLNNSPEWFFFYYAIAKIGAVIVPINTRFRSNDLEYVLKQSDSSLLVLGNSYRNANYYEILKGITPELEHSIPGQLKAEKLPRLRKVISVGFLSTSTISFKDLIDRGKQISNDELRKRESEVSPEDLFAIYYTSGTTGFPKGVMHSHKMIINMNNVAERLQMKSSDKILLFLPLFHVYASQVGLTAACTRGACIVLMEAFESGKVIKLIKEEKVSILYGFDSMYLDIMNDPNFNQKSIKSIRVAMCSGTKGILEKVVKKNDFKVVNSYGMTESTGVTSLTFLDDSDDTIISKNGYPLPGISIKIVDPYTKQTLSNGNSGEICVKGHSVMLGYYNKPIETKEVLTEDGWLYTGDKGYIDELGYLHLSGRIKDIIRVGGENVDPIEVDAVLISHPAVFKACTIAVPDERLTEVCASFVQLQVNKNKINEEELISYCKTKIASFKVPRYIFIVDEFPTTTTGKVQNFKLKQMAFKLLENKKAKSSEV
ncbi:hypothetical protein DCC39_06945 [Pueribacillus theae]|uniref:AMP-binding protein n=1 Tax=Pueribacillus theae TaxID=2171751 RepID=A0A2U1K4P7_9BACI|nr:AMP-binding protein [Pueribacillus theae]PWA12164.1 hypothetical protein DCC39_06945 [Pueribacillus theae]